MIAKGDYEAADQWLIQIQSVAPDFLPAYEERARLYEVRGERARASEQWSQIIYRSTETPLYQKAVAERLRLSESQPEPVSGNNRLVRIASINRTDSSSGDDYDEMRTLTIHLAPAAPGIAVDREALKVNVIFFDRDTQLGAITRTGVAAPKDPLAARPSRETRKAARWFQPRISFRGLARKRHAAGRDCVYHGYAVRVFYNGTLQDQTALPRNLIAQAEREPEGAVSSTIPPEDNKL